MESPSTDTDAPDRADAALAHLLCSTARNQRREAASALLRAADLEQAARPHATCCIPWGVLRFVARAAADPSDPPASAARVLDDADQDADPLPKVDPLACATLARVEVVQAIASLATAAAALEATPPETAPPTRVHVLWFFAQALHMQLGCADSFAVVASRARTSITQLACHGDDSEAR